MTDEEMVAYHRDHNIPCPNCGKCDFTDIRKFNLMFKTNQGVTEDSADRSISAPRPRRASSSTSPTSQRTTRRKLPFGIGQIGKSFRNEITPGNFIFRLREFEQMELEFFCKPGTDLEWFDYWRTFCHDWLLEPRHEGEQSAPARPREGGAVPFYSKATTDFEYLFPFGWGELWGVADRTDYDLTQHQKVSGKDMTYFDQETNRALYPLRHRAVPRRGPHHAGVAAGRLRRGGRGRGEERHPRRAAPSIRRSRRSSARCCRFQRSSAPRPRRYTPSFQKSFMCDYDDAGSIGKRYRREDEIGTPFCVTVDFQTVGDENTPADNCVTVRDRDTMEQVRIPIHCRRRGS
jgi:glycyl-tRNA synthetase